MPSIFLVVTLQMVAFKSNFIALSDKWSLCSMHRSDFLIYLLIQMLNQIKSDSVYKIDQLREYQLTLSDVLILMENTKAIGPLDPSISLMKYLEVC